MQANRAKRTRRGGGVPEPAALGVRGTVADACPCQGCLLDTTRCRDPILDSINEGVFTVDLDWRITSFNRAAERITGMRREQAIGQRCRDVLRASVCEENCIMRRVLDTGEPAVNTSVFVSNAEGTRIPIKISAAVVRDTAGRVIGGVETFQDLRLVEELRRQLKDQYSFADIVGKSAAMKRLFELLPRVADSHSTVLIHGESGTGKELVARAIHSLSRRRKKRFVAVNCGALPDTLLESELFGYKAGAFTDARRDKLGRLALAEGGTLLLDEIGDISAAMQVRLLRVLQDKVYEPLGAVEPVRANVRIIAATNRDLGKLVGEGKFREDLYYRIHVIPVAVPSLRERREDIPLLVEHFIAVHNRVRDQEITGLSRDALAMLMKHDFPGNVRELQNILEHAFVLCQNRLIEPDDFPPGVVHGDGSQTPASKGAVSLKVLEHRLIEDALRRCRGNRSLAAQELGIDVSTLYRKLRRYRLDVPPEDGRARPW